MTSNKSNNRGRRDPLLARKSGTWVKASVEIELLDGRSKKTV
ncbi:MAG: hypothetical protein RID09_05945 [Coleofasciculus sp. G1-WW12-02]